MAPLDEWSARRRDHFLTSHTTHNRETSMPPAGFEPTISAAKRRQTYGAGLLQILLNFIRYSMPVPCHRSHSFNCVIVAGLLLTLISCHFQSCCHPDSQIQRFKRVKLKSSNGQNSEPLLCLILTDFLPNNQALNQSYGSWNRCFNTIHIWPYSEFLHETIVSSKKLDIIIICLTFLNHALHPSKPLGYQAKKHCVTCLNYEVPNRKQEKFYRQ